MLFTFKGHTFAESYAPEFQPVHYVDCPCGTWTEHREQELELNDIRRQIDTYADLSFGELIIKLGYGSPK